MSHTQNRILQPLLTASFVNKGRFSVKGIGLLSIRRILFEIFLSIVFLLLTHATARSTKSFKFSNLLNSMYLYIKSIGLHISFLLTSKHFSSIVHFQKQVTITFTKQAKFCVERILSLRLSWKKLLLTKLAIKQTKIKSGLNLSPNHVSIEEIQIHFSSLNLCLFTRFSALKLFTIGAQNSGLGMWHEYLIQSTT